MNTITKHILRIAGKIQRGEDHTWRFNELQSKIPGYSEKELMNEIDSLIQDSIINGIKAVDSYSIRGLTSKDRKKLSEI